MSEAAKRVPRSPPSAGAGGSRSGSTRSAAQRHADRIIFGEHVAAFVALNGALAWMKLTTWPDAPWGWWVPPGWGAGLALHGLWAWGRMR